MPTIQFFLLYIVLPCSKYSHHARFYLIFIIQGKYATFVLYPTYSAPTMQDIIDALLMTLKIVSCNTHSIGSTIKDNVAILLAFQANS